MRRRADFACGAGAAVGAAVGAAAGKDLMRARDWRVLALAAAYLYLPILVLSLFAFSDDAVIAFPITGLTLRWFGALAGNAAFLDGFATSMTIAIPVGAVSALGGLAAALALRGATLRPRAAWWAAPFAALLLAPFLTPRTVLAVAQSMALSELGLRRGMAVLGAAQVLVILPFTTALLTAALLRVDPRLEEAGRDLGAGPWACFQRVTLPLVRGPLMAACSAGMILSLADVTLATFLAGRAQPLSVVVASEFMREMRPDLNAMQVVVLSVTALAVALAALWRRRR